MRSVLFILPTIKRIGVFLAVSAVIVIPRPAVAAPGQEQGPRGPASADEEIVFNEPAGRGRPTSQTADEATLPAGEPSFPGHLMAEPLLGQLQQEIIDGLDGRKITTRFGRFTNYADYKLRSSDHSSSRSELNGLCRLAWYEHLLRNPLQAPAEAEKFSRELHLGVLDERRSLANVMETAARKLDLEPYSATALIDVESPEAALRVIEQSIGSAKVGYNTALASLTESEIEQLTKYLYPVFVSQNRVGHTLRSRSTGRSLCRLMEKFDRNAMHRAAGAFVPIADPQFLDELRAIPVPGDDAPSVAGVTGCPAQRIDTPNGSIVIGGPGRNVYRLDDMLSVNAVIDLGGDDVYFEGTTSRERPVLLVIDLEGNDAYEGTKPGVQGAAILGISMLLDVAGNDVYRAKDMGQASCLVGAGILVDYAGNDVYVGTRRVQGQAVCGVGALIDRKGNDRYHGALWTQGMGGPLGFGLLDDLEGEDHYYTGGLYICSYADDEENPTPGYEGWGQGMGAGLRGVANGGVGVILDGGGDDLYEYDYLSHGGGYWCGTGFARDFGGNDTRLGATRKTFDQGSRRQRSFTRFANGFGCHYALGFLFDDQGNDSYKSTIMGVGYSWDCSVGYLCDFGGDDQYSGNEGVGAQAGLGVLFDYGGDDKYLGSRMGYASSGISYHPMPSCGGNFSFLVDWGGTDEYGCRAKNDSYIRRGSYGGFLIDRETPETVAKADEDTPRNNVTKR